MNNIPYTYTTGWAIFNPNFPERKTRVLFRRSPAAANHEGNIEVQVVKEVNVPEFTQSFNSFMKKMENLGKGLVERTIETKLSATDEYGNPEPEGTHIIKGWTHKLSDAHRAALAEAPEFK